MNGQMARQSSDTASKVAARPPVRGRNGGTLNPFRPGESGNPAGRERFKEVTKLARDASARSVRRLAELVEDPDGRVAYLAAEAVLNRAFGKREPDLHEPPRYKLDLKRLSLDELRVLLKAVERGAIELPPEQDAEAKAIEGTVVESANAD